MFLTLLVLLTCRRCAAFRLLSLFLSGGTLHVRRFLACRRSPLWISIFTVFCRIFIPSSRTVWARRAPARAWSRLSCTVARCACAFVSGALWAVAWSRYESRNATFPFCSCTGVVGIGCGTAFGCWFRAFCANCSGVVILESAACVGAVAVTPTTFPSLSLRMTTTWSVTAPFALAYFRTRLAQSWLCVYIRKRRTDWY